MTAALLNNPADDELTASQVLSRVYGFGALEADIALSEIDVQDRSRIVESYNGGRINEIDSILNPVSEPVQPKQIDEPIDDQK